MKFGCRTRKKQKHFSIETRSAHNQVRSISSPTADFICLDFVKTMTVLTFGVATTIAATGSTAPFAAPALAGTLTGM
jgi:hypothetical protein